MPHFRSLMAQSTLWIALPLAAIVLGVLLTSAFVYQRLVASLLIDRDRQLATLSAARLYETLDDYTQILQEITLSLNGQSPEGTPHLRGQFPPRALEVFNAGLLLVDAKGQVVGVTPPKSNPIGNAVGAELRFEALREGVAVFSDVFADARTGQDTITIGVPLLDSEGAFQGALLGAIHLHTSALADPVRRLRVGDEGFAYLVDRNGRVIFHPDSAQIGADFSDRSFVLRASQGEQGGTLGQGPGGEQLVLGYAPVGGTGWAVVIREQWEDVISPATKYGLVMGLSALVALMAAVTLLWKGVARVTRPVRILAGQAQGLPHGEVGGPLPETGIEEVDALSSSFERMAGQILSYRAGLRRYALAITQSHEEERRRLARDLHDQTIQDLVALLRQIELQQAAEPDPDRLERLEGLRSSVETSIQGIRDLTRGLRPLALEDLGLIPALRALVHEVSMREGPGLQVQFQLQGEPLSLTREQELNLYRVTQEALANVRAHSQASWAEVRLTYEVQHVLLEVLDGGVGFEPPSTLAELSHKGNYGLMGIQERVWASGGFLELESGSGQGTRLKVTLPYHSPSSLDPYGATQPTASGGHPRKV